MKDTLSTNAKIKRALAVRLILTPVVSISLTVVGVLVANAIERKIV